MKLEHAEGRHHHGGLPPAKGGATKKYAVLAQNVGGQTWGFPVYAKDVEDALKEAQALTFPKWEVVRLEVLG